MMSQAKSSYPLSLKIMMNDIKICIQELEGTVASGCICHCCLREPVAFRGIGDMVLKIDELCDRMGFPEASPPRRTLHPERKGGGELHLYHEFKDFGLVRGEKFSFFIKMRYRQNASWQGSVHFSEDTRTYQFRSVLELMGYIMEKMNEFEKRGGDYAERSVEGSYAGQLFPSV